jgi:hypothetical protein
MLPSALRGPSFVRGRVHIGVLSISVVLQSFRRLRRPGKKYAVTVNTVYPLSQPNFLLARENRRIASAGLWKR